MTDGRHEAHVGETVGLVDDDLADVIETQAPIENRSSSRPGQATTIEAPASSALR